MHIPGSLYGLFGKIPKTMHLRQVDTQEKHEQGKRPHSATKIMDNLLN